MWGSGGGVGFLNGLPPMWGARLHPGWPDPAQDLDVLRPVRVEQGGRGSACWAKETELDSPRVRTVTSGVRLVGLRGGTPGGCMAPAPAVGTPALALEPAPATVPFGTGIERGRGIPELGSFRSQSVYTIN